ncbi:MAG: dienelactone hydrolase family protein [Gammaproteobacteria bacterium]|nr:dienelactone hydrolase family protein [Gammaproteobacteria bacterium]
MFTARFRKSGLLATLLAGSLLLTACEKDAPANDEADKAAARENVEAMSREHAADTTEPSPAAEIAPAQPVISDPKMPYVEVGDQNVYGYFSAPSDVFEPLPALIVIHEWWGLNDNVRAMADRLAGEGYMVLAIDLYGGRTASTPAEARVLMREVVEDPETARDNIRGAYEFLVTAGAPRVGSLGWCFGGGWSLNTALLFPDELDASVIYYGQVTDDEGKLHEISAPILGLFAADDTGITVESVEAFRGALQRLRKEHEIHIYPGVGHAFANPTGRNYDANAATDAWNKTVEFLGRHLSSDGS